MWTKTRRPVTSSASIPTLRFPPTRGPSLRTATVVTGPTPTLLQETISGSDDRFQLVPVDGDHSRPGSLRISGVLDVLDDEAVLLFYDAYFEDVALGIDDILAERADWPGRQRAWFRPCEIRIRTISG